MASLTLAEFLAIAKQKQYNLVPVFEEVLADTLTPVSTFLKVRSFSHVRQHCNLWFWQIRGDNYSCLLESVEGGERQARYSFIATQPYKTLTQSSTCLCSFLLVCAYHTLQMEWIH